MSIFTCGLCTKDYNELNKRPLVLPCGHVYCEECIIQMKVIDSTKGVKCPSDSIIHKIEIQKIPICAQILINLPKQSKKGDFIHCARHQTKKIKFYCRTHNVFPCSICITEHTDHDIVCFEANKTAFIAEVKALSKQIDSEKTLFYQNKLKDEQYGKVIVKYQENQLALINNHFNQLMTLLQERKNKLINELKKYIEDKKKQLDSINKRNSKTTDMFMNLGNKNKYIEDLYNKGEYELFVNFKQKILNEIKASIQNDETILNNDPLPEYFTGNTVRLINIIGEFRIKPHSISKPRTPNLSLNVNSISNLRNCDINIEDTKSIDSISTFMLHNNDTTNIFKQNLLTANANDGDTHHHQSTDVNKKNESKTEYQHFVSLTKPETPVSIPGSNNNPNKSQSNREHTNNNQIYVQKPFQQQNNDKKTINTHINGLVNKHNQNQVISQQVYQSKNTNPVSIKIKNFQSNERMNGGRILNTEDSYDKSRKKSNDYIDYKYSPIFSSPNENKDIFGIDNKYELNKKRYINSIKSNTNSNSSNKNILAPKHTYNRSCNKSKKKKKASIEP